MTRPGPERRAAGRMDRAMKTGKRCAALCCAAALALGLAACGGSASRNATAGTPAPTPASSAAAAPSPTPAPAEWEQLYRAYLTDETYLGDGQAEYYTDLEIAAALYDMDSDGIPELLVSNGSGAAATRGSWVYTASGGEVRYLGAVGLSLFCAPDPAYPGIFTLTDMTGAQYGDARFSEVRSWDYADLRDGAVEHVSARMDMTADSGGTTSLRCDAGDALFELAGSPLTALPLTSVSQIQSGGWEAFRDLYVTGDAASAGA